MALSDFINAWEAGGRAGREARTRRTLADYMPAALGGDQKAIQSIYAVDPEAGYKVQGMARQQREQDYSDLARAADFYSQTGDPSAYAYLQQNAARLGPQFAGLPATLETPEDKEGSMKWAQAIASNFGGTGQNADMREFANLTSSAGLSDEERKRAARIQLGLDPRAVSAGMQVKQGQDGAWYAVNPSQQTATPIMVGGPQPEYLAPGEKQGFPVHEVNGMPVRIDPDLDPNVIRSMEQNPDAWAQGNPMQLPPTVRQPAPQPFMAPQKPAPRAPAPRAVAQRQPAPVSQRQPEAPKPPRITDRTPEINRVETGLKRIEGALKALDDNRLFDGGPLDSFALQYTEEGQEFAAAVGEIQQAMNALTRVPGMGSQSDLEAKLAMLQYPSLEMSPEVNKRTLENLRQFVNDLRARSGAPQQTTGGGNDDDLINKYLGQ